MGHEKHEGRTYARIPPAGHGHSEPEIRLIDPTLHVNEAAEAHSSEPWDAERTKDGKAKAKTHVRHRASRCWIVSPELASDRQYRAQPHAALSGLTAILRAEVDGG